VSGSVERWLAAATRARPAHPALYAGERAWSYAELEAWACALAARLARAGVRPGDRVGVLTDPGPETIALIHALMAAGATLVALNTRLVADELRGLLEDSRPRLVVAGEPHAARARDAGAETLTLDALESLDPQAGFSARNRLELAGDHAILFTSGTTGRPKGVRLTYANQLASARASALRLGVQPDDRWLLCMPTHHIGGLSIPLRCAIGATSVDVQPGFDPERVAARLAREPVRLATMVPTMLARVFEVGLARRPTALRTLLLGGGPIPAVLVEKSLARGIPTAPTYGLTEAASQVATLPPEDLALAGDTAGPALPDTELRIARADGSDAPHGEPGQILVRGPQVMRGYLDRPEETARTLAGGWLHTGDVGTLDAASRLRVLDRRDDLIVSGGENVYPAEVEAVLLAHPQVREAAVIARADPEWGQAVHAVVVRAPGSALEASALDAWLRARLAGFKRPRGYSFREALPRTASGKLRRADLRRELDGRDPVD
jgi:O-succinylbenzoic acid--CoA ligase